LFVFVFVCTGTRLFSLQHLSTDLYRIKERVLMHWKVTPGAVIVLNDPFDLHVVRKFVLGDVITRAVSRV
jgi:hypothetical protein